MVRMWKLSNQVILL